MESCIVKFFRLYDAAFFIPEKLYSTSKKTQVHLI